MFSKLHSHMLYYYCLLRHTYKHKTSKQNSKPSTSLSDQQCEKSPNWLQLSPEPFRLLPWEAVMRFVYHKRALWRNERTYCRYFGILIAHKRAITLVFCHQHWFGVTSPSIGILRSEYFEIRRLYCPWYPHTVAKKCNLVILQIMI